MPSESQNKAKIKYRQKIKSKQINFEVKEGWYDAFVGYCKSKGQKRTVVIKEAIEQSAKTDNFNGFEDFYQQETKED